MCCGIFYKFLQFVCGGQLSTLVSDLVTRFVKLPLKILIVYGGQLYTLASDLVCVEKKIAGN